MSGASMSKQAEVGVTVVYCKLKKEEDRQHEVQECACHSRPAVFMR